MAEALDSTFEAVLDLPGNLLRWLASIYFQDAVARPLALHLHLNSGMKTLESLQLVLSIRLRIQMSDTKRI